MNSLVSIIIVHYHVKEELLACLKSILDSTPKTSCEIIVVDNDEVKSIKKDLLKKFPEVKYVPNTNKGFGHGNNVGAKQAKGEYLFFLNPDTVVFKDTVDVLFNFLNNNKKAGVVAPFLLHENKKPFKQGVNELTPLRAIFSLSFIHKLFPNNPISRQYFTQWEKIETKEVDVVPGTAFMIDKKLFELLGGFDEKFFLYFEEFDLCKRIKKKGYQLFITPNAKIIHLWERSTRHRNDINKIFNQSRFYYFRKHFGLIPALIINSFLNFGKFSLLSLLILIFAAFLLFYKLDVYMPFIGDQGWFYLSARDMLLTGHIPLVGITSSHIWLHQGALWTYILAVALWICKFNPLAGGYLTAVVGLITIWLLYKIGSEMFSKRVGILTSLLYATSPLVILSGRMPYHTSVIPLVTLLWFYTLYKWINGFKYGFPLLICLLAILYNLELSMIMLVPIFLFVFTYGFVKRTKWAGQVKSSKIIILSLLALLIPMLPMLIYDTQHGYPQTLKFGAWIIYKIVNFIGVPLVHRDVPSETYQSMVLFASPLIARLIFINSAYISWLLLACSFIYLLLITIRYIKKNQMLQSYSLLFLLFVIPVSFYLAEKTNSGAYWPVFYPTVAFMLAILLDWLMSHSKLFYVSVIALFIIIYVNVSGLLQTHYYIGKGGITFTEQVLVAKQIVQESRGKEYNLVGRGTGSQYESFTMNYEYLTWWLGHGPSHKKQPLQFIIDATPQGIKIINK